MIKDAKNIITSYDGPRLRIMEVCGTHTHEMFRTGIRSLLPPMIELISGPGCPVCVTPAAYIDEAVWLALDSGVTICTFGDLVRVPGSEMSLAGARSKGAKVNVVYSPLDAFVYAENHREEDVVFLSVGFETTTPASCLAIKKASESKLQNFSVLTANKTMPAAYRSLKGYADAFLYPGHVHAIIGTKICEELLNENISGVIAGFTSGELLTALAAIITKCIDCRPFYLNAYPRVVAKDGNMAAQHIMNTVMEPCDSVWRGIGTIIQSGLQLNDKYAAFDAQKKYSIPSIQGKDNPMCRCGEVLKGDCKPTQCPVFNKGCTPEHPIGACMVSHEGTCSAYYQYGGFIHD